MKKIMFSDVFGLTEAVLSGRKTQTRRIIPQPFNEKIIAFQHQYYDATFDMLNGTELLNHYFFTEKLGKLPYQIGEVVAVAQCYKDIACGALFDDLKEAYRKEPTKLAGWTNKMFVRSDLMPNRIRITNVRVERLQDISDDDCIVEGVVEACVSNNWGNSASHWEYNVPYEDKVGRAKLLRGMTPQEAYAILIDKISGNGTFQSNPWVFVYDFKLLK